MAIAIHSSSSTIQLKWYNDAEGLSTSVGTIDFTGQHPVLFNNGLLEIRDDVSRKDLVLYYLREDYPKSLFARMERDGYLIEHEIIKNLQVSIVELVSAREEDNQLLLLARDSAGRDVTLYSEAYFPEMDEDGFAVSVAIVSASHIDSSVLAAVPSNTALLDLTIVSGRYGEPIVSPVGGSVAGETTLLDLKIESGEYV